MIDERPPVIDLGRPRSVLEMVTAALSLYVRYPLLFGLLALAVVAPYEVIVLAVTGTAPLGQQSVSAGTGFTLVLLELALIGPLVSALDVHAVAAIGRGERPGLVSVSRLGARSLPVVAAAQIIAGIGIGVGLIAFVIPGVILALRWAVVAQAAAVEGTDWLGALRRSGELARGQYLHVLGIVVLVSLANYGIAGAGAAIAGRSAHPAQVALGILVETITRSFTALTTAVLYFDLLSRNQRRGGSSREGPVAS
ncbi:MAG: hypothetical protein JOY58_08505 [Solirubrobacterales bacterium]|nr:hypothetical protein [Solirubrobacterales bacterium]